MSGSNPKVADEVERYLCTGDTDAKHLAWSGGFMERVNRAHDDLRGALLQRVRQLASGKMHHPVPDGDTVALTRTKVEPMVRGLFHRAEQDLILSKLEKCIRSVEPVLEGWVSGRDSRWVTERATSARRRLLSRVHNVDEQHFASKSEQPARGEAVGGLSLGQLTGQLVGSGSVGSFRRERRSLA
ncbi:MAG TPA: hypothetical protein VGL19_20475 [Polyangiaceae bacterium]